MSELRLNTVTDKDTEKGVNVDALHYQNTQLVRNLGAWQPGLVFENKTDYATCNDQAIVVSGGTTLPYTTQGADPTVSPDSGNVVPFAGVNTVNTVNTAASISELVAFVAAADGQKVNVTAYHDGWAAVNEDPKGGGIFVWDSSRPRSDHNGGTVIDPDAPFPTLWGDGTQESAWFSSSNPGNGCWVRILKDSVDVCDYGAFANTGLSTSQIQQCLDVHYNKSPNSDVREVVTFGSGDVFFVDEPVSLNGVETSNRNKGLIIRGGGSKLKATPSFTVDDNKAIFESLTRKNGVNLTASRERVQIYGLDVDCNNLAISGYALSGFVRGSGLYSCRSFNGYHGVQVSGSWSFEIDNHTSKGNTKAGILVGSYVDVLEDANGDPVDNGVEFGVPARLHQEGYMYSGDSISIHCNAFKVTGGACISNFNGVQIHFGSDGRVSDVTSELNTSMNFVCTAFTGALNVSSNYFEAGKGLWFGRDSEGIVHGLNFSDNQVYGQRIHRRGLINSEITNNLLESGTGVVSKGEYQRNFGCYGQFKNTYANADIGQLKNSYKFERDGVFSTDSADRVSHAGYFKTVLDDCKINRPIMSAQEETLELSSHGSGAVTLESRTVSTTPTQISAVRRSLVVVYGNESGGVTSSFVDLLLVIGYSSFSVVSEKTRGTPATRNYSVSGYDLSLSMSEGEYEIGVTRLS